MTDFQQFLVTVIAWGVLIPLVAGLISTGTVFWLFSQPMRRLPHDAHWSETARHFWHIRSARSLALIWIGFVACVSSYDELADRGDLWLLALIVPSAVAGCTLGFREAARGLDLPKIVKNGGLRSTLALMVLFPALPSMLAIMALTWKRGLSTESFGIVAVVLLVDIALTMGGSVAILRALRLFRPVEDSLQSSARELATNQGVQLRHVMQMDLPMANAFAFFWTKDLAFTSATLTSLTHDELSSVISHELGHLREGLFTRWTRLIAFLSIATISLAPAAIHDGQPVIAVALFAAYSIISRYTARFHQRLENAADQQAHLTEKEDGVYARALEKIHAVSLIPAVLHPRHPYPSLYDRMTGAGLAPDFPRPQAPGRLAPLLCGIAATALFFGLCYSLGQVVPM